MRLHPDRIPIVLFVRDILADIERTAQADAVAEPSDLPW